MFTNYASRLYMTPQTPENANVNNVPQPAITPQDAQGVVSKIHPVLEEAERIRKQQEENAQRLEELIQTLLDSREPLQDALADIDAQLEALGYTPEGQPSQPAKRSAGERFCSICNAKGHDMRAHRGQYPKRPFTPAEIRQLAK